MSRVAPPPDPETRRRGMRRLLLVAIALCLPIIVLAWFVVPAGWDALAIITTLAYVAGVLALSVFVTSVVQLRTQRLWPRVAIAVAAVIAGAVLLQVWPPDQAQIAYASGQVLAPPERALHLTYLYVLVFAPWQLGVFVLFGTVGAALTRWRSRSR
ncbi:hypothetical protein [Amnibacterium kyonggiense]|uniref:Uncharacterized protein n=1 Tax=Amnibacterium kyonggiense TaxID=595671 RepID=A0A4R7FQX4_9MICO|nr:hypothetical protein [Amnibacterium kyonggiense]TDS80163.1 hypothetical protein CLV52_0717 [Amnibacterium kyonggiense]